MGRPPAKWMYEAAAIKGEFEPFYSFIDLANIFGTSYRSMKRFCTLYKIEGKYLATEKGTVIRLVSFKDFQKKLKEYVKSYSR